MRSNRTGRTKQSGLKQAFQAASKFYSDPFFSREGVIFTIVVVKTVVKIRGKLAGQVAYTEVRNIIK